MRSLYFLHLKYFKQHHKERHEKDSGEVKKESKPSKAPKPTQPSGPKDPLAIRTIVVSGLPSSIDSKTLWKKVRKYNGAEKADWPIQKDGIEDKSTGALPLNITHRFLYS